MGVLALQGNFEEHGLILADLKVRSVEVRSASDLAACDALILPGGESTVMMQLLTESGLDREIICRVQDGMPVFGTCAGAILLSDTHLKLMDISVERNAYGRQTESFQTELHLSDGRSIAASFIRAPKISRVGEHVETLAVHNGCPVLVRSGSIMAATFHTETEGEIALHRLFLDIKKAP